MTLPSKMQVIEILRPGPPDVLRPAERPVPQPGPGEILIRIAYAGINRPDVLQRAGKYDPPPDASDLPGLECSGHVAAVGEGVTRWKEGDPVCALLPGGGYAEYALTHGDHALAIPDGVSMTEAGLVPETFFTVWSNVFERGGLKAGETFLVHGGASGIGTTAIQMASIFGARVFTTAGTDEKCQACIDLGAEQAINYRVMDFGGLTRDWTEGRGVDLILDMVGGSYIDRNINALARDGRMVMIAQLAGAKAEINFAKIMVKRLTVTGSTLRPQSIEAKAKIAQALEKEIWPHLASGRIRPVVDQIFPMAEATEAHRRMEQSAHIGKIALKVAG